MSFEPGPVRAAHRFDEAALERYLRAHLPGFEAPLSVQQFGGGQSNPTFLLTAGARRYVLRKKPPGQLLKSAHQVDREYRIMKALAADRRAGAAHACAVRGRERHRHGVLCDGFSGGADFSRSAIARYGAGRAQRRSTTA